MVDDPRATLTFRMSCTAPGHTPGSMSPCSSTRPAKFRPLVGDVLLARLDRPAQIFPTRPITSSFADSIRKRPLWPLGDDITFVPGPPRPDLDLRLGRKTNSFVRDLVVFDDDE